MTISKSTLHVGLLLALFWLAPVLFADDVSRCTQIADNGQRLACYDRLFMKNAVKRYQARPEAKTELEPEPEPRSQAVTVNTALPPVSVSEAERPGPDTTMTKIPVFGTEQLEASRKPSKTGGNISAFVSKISKRPRGEYVFELDNGQTWTQTTVRWIKVKRDDRVTILKRSLGGYTLRTSGGASTPVRRIK